MKITRSALNKIIKEVVEQEIEGPKSDVEYITADEAEALINKSNGAIFTATFVKVNGEVRKMNARKGVRAYLQGGQLAYNPAERGLITVYDVDCGRKAKAKGEDPKCYKMINKKTMRSLRIGNKQYVIKKGEASVDNPTSPPTPAL